MAMIQTVEIFYSFQCPYSYLSLDRLSQLENIYDIKVLWQPFSAKAAGQQNSGSQLFSEKVSYIKEDCQRLAEKQNLHLNFAENWPEAEFDPERSTRGALIAQDLGVSFEYNIKMFDRWWSQTEDPNDQDFLIELCEDLELNPNEFAGAVSSADTRERVKGTYRRGRKLAVYETPTMLIGEERFLGIDRIPLLEERLTDMNLRKPSWV